MSLLNIPKWRCVSLRVGTSCCGHCSPGGEWSAVMTAFALNWINLLIGIFRFCYCSKNGETDVASVKNWVLINHILYIPLHTPTHTHLHTPAHTPTHTYTHTYTHTRTYTHTHAPTHTHILYIRTYIHAHIHCVILTVCKEWLSTLASFNCWVSIVVNRNNCVSVTVCSSIRLLIHSSIH